MWPDGQSYILSGLITVLVGSPELCARTFWPQSPTPYPKLSPAFCINPRPCNLPRPTILPQHLLLCSHQYLRPVCQLQLGIVGRGCVHHCYMKLHPRNQLLITFLSCVKPSRTLLIHTEAAEVRVQPSKCHVNLGTRLVRWCF